MGDKDDQQPTDGLDALLDERRRFDPPAAFRERAVAADPAVYDRAAADPEAFWSGFASELSWSRPWETTLQGEGPDARWFVGGQMNASVNCLDRHLEAGLRNKAALIWEGEPGDRSTWTYFDLHREVEGPRTGRAQDLRPGLTERGLQGDGQQNGDKKAHRCILRRIIEVP